MERARCERQARPPHRPQVPPRTQVFAIASGKGGVGKSSVTVNLAAALARRGHAVGVLDADIWGFSVPRMLGVEGRLAAGAEDGDDRGKIVAPAQCRSATGRRSRSCPWACSSTTRRRR